MRNYTDIKRSIRGLVDGENDVIAKMATVSCELFHGFGEFHWVGFYRRVDETTLKIGPYQGGHGCIVIPFSRGVCGAAASQEKTQVVEDVDLFPDHIACSTTTRSEIVVPVFGPRGRLIAVLDIDSDHPGAFDQHDVRELERLMGIIFGESA